MVYPPALFFIATLVSQSFILLNDLSFFVVPPASQSFPSSNSTLAKTLAPNSYHARPYYRRHGSVTQAKNPPLARFGDVVPIAGRVRLTKHLFQTRAY